jgi:cysteinyl-tRNA synthetase
VRFFLLATHYRSPVDFGEDRLTECEKSLDGFYRLIETFNRITKPDFFFVLPASQTREGSSDLTGEPAAYFAELSALRTRFLEAMDDDFNTGGAVAALFDMRKTLNGFIADQKLEGEGRSNANALAAMIRGVTLFKELANILGVFRQPVTKPSSGGGNEAFTNDLMQLLITLRADSRKAKQFEIADKIRKSLTDLKVTLEDRPDGTGWRRDA